MRSAKVLILIAGLAGLLALPSPAIASDDDEEYTLEFTPTQNAPPGAQGTMTIKVNGEKGETEVEFKVRGAYPDTVYTIWIVFNPLTWRPDDPANATTTKVSATSASARPGFPAEGNGVSPLAPLGAGFTGGMGLDPGATFVTDEKGDGKIDLKVDYDLLRAAPVSNKDMIAQCVPGPAASDGNCYAPSKLLRITTTWLRKYIAEFPLTERGVLCANYDATYDPESPLYDPVGSKGQDARFWQCIDPAMWDADKLDGLPRVHRYEFDHFRLANHPDDLTHGFIGGNGTEHWIDMVGRRGDLVPKH